MIKEAISLSAYAKINLHLEVLNRRKDGFHEIVSIFQRISLADELLIEKIPKKNICEVYSPLDALPADNTIVKAYKEFQALTGIEDGIRVHIVKRIPAGAGLGGGSSDAAAVLLGLTGIFNADLSVEKLATVALNVGSDVPFFLKNSTALVRGRGEFLKPLRIRSVFFGVLVFPEIMSSTEAAYRLLNRTEKTLFPSFNPEDFCSRGCKEWPFFNSFEEPLFGAFPEIKEVKAGLLNCGADFALMSGTGSSIYGLFTDEKIARMAFFEFSRRYKRCFLFLPLAS